MKKLLFPAFAFLAMMASCAKEADVNEETRNKVEVRALIDNSDVKTNYDIDGSTATFYWTGTEVFGRLYYSGGFGEDEYTSTTSASNKETSLAFTGYEDETSTNYALYPKWTKDGEPGLGWRSNPLDLYMCPSLAYDANNPLKGIIPMLGKLQNGEFVFTPLTAVIAVTVKNLPSTARSIYLCSATKRLSGYYRVSSYPTSDAKQLDGITLGLTTTMASYASTVADANKKIFTFANGLDEGEHTFYFPVSVGAIDDLQIVVADGNNTALQTVSYTKTITTIRGQITRFPVMDLAKATQVALTGSATSPYAYVSKFGPEVQAVRFAVNVDEAQAKAGAATGALITLAGEDNKVSLAGDLSASGKYYIGYQVLNTDNEVILEGAQAFYFLTDADKALIDAEYLQVNGSFAGYTGSTKTITVRESNDATKGNVMITEFQGVCYDVSESTVAHSGWVDGSPIYGQYPVSDMAYFYNVDQQVFYTDGNGASHYLRGASYGGGWSVSNQIRIKFNSDGYTAGTAHDLVIWDAYLTNYWKTSTGSGVDTYGGSFVCNKAATTYTVAGSSAEVLGTAWDPSIADNDLIYDPATMTYSQQFNVPGSVGHLEFKVAKNHGWDTAWPTDNVAIDFLTGYASTLTITFTPMNNTVSYTVTSEASEYKLHILPEIASNLAGPWGTEYSVWGVYDFEKLDDTPIGEYTYASFSIPNAIIDDQTHDLYFKGQNNCEVLIDDMTFYPDVYNYYFRTDGFNLVPVTDPGSPEALPGGNKLWICITNATSVGIYGWDGDINVGWDSPLEMTAAPGKLSGMNWFYLDLTGYAGSKLVARIGYNDEAYSAQTTDITDNGNAFSFSSSLYFYTTDWTTDGKLNWQLLP